MQARFFSNEKFFTNTLFFLRFPASNNTKLAEEEDIVEKFFKSKFIEGANPKSKLIISLFAKIFV